MTALHPGWPRPTNPSEAAKQFTRSTTASLERWYAERGSRFIGGSSFEAYGQPLQALPIPDKTCMVTGCNGFARRGRCFDCVPGTVG